MRSPLPRPPVDLKRLPNPHCKHGALSRCPGGNEHLHGTGAIARLEAALRQEYGVRYVLAVSSATVGLFALANAVEVRGTEMIVPALSWGGTVSGALFAGAHLKFADVEAGTLGLNPKAVLDAVTKRTRAIISVDLFGVPANDAELRRVADDHGLWYFHDGAPSLGARIGGRPAGTAAHAQVLSFGSGKVLSTGEGGAILTNDKDLYERLVWQTQHPYRQKRELGLVVHNEFALNLRLSPFLAKQATEELHWALGLVRARQNWGSAVLKILDASGMTEPLDYAGLRLEPSFHVLTAAWAGRSKPAALLSAVGAAGLDARLSPVHLRPLYRHAALQAVALSHTRAHCPVAERQSRRRFELVPGSPLDHEESPDREVA